ncbi:hypothetical protein [Salinispora cortesiana]|uniref:hypothetical protein n=1 Tax=Salinispora cortesiana TaxID=1305843 RepID=UPI000424F13A|nr:hypothetical protein [Salinispora cortesiana]
MLIQHRARLLTGTDNNDRPNRHSSDAPLPGFGVATRVEISVPRAVAGRYP